MSDELYEFKLKLLDTGYFKHQKDSEYICTCPFCGKRKHCYVVFDLVGNTPLLYNCFRCNSSGIVNKKFLEYFNLEEMIIPKMKGSRKIEINKTISSKARGANIFNVSDTNIVNLYKAYIEYRIGVTPTDNEMSSFQLLTDPDSYAREYLNRNNGKSFYEQKIWFRLDNGNIHGRHMYREDIRWMKFDTDRVKSVGVYSIQKPFDIEANINVCICEGIFDAIGLYYYNKEHDIGGNYIYCACLGKNYEAGINRVISKGIFGESVNIRIYKDSDVSVRKIHVNPNKAKLFKSISIYENTKSHDYGVPADMIDTKKIIL